MINRKLLGLLVAFGLLGLVYSLSTPLFEAPDEPWHYAYVRWIAEGKGLPRLDDDASGAYQEAAQPPLYYLVTALVTSPLSDDDLTELFWHNPQFGYQAGGTVNDNKNMLVHTDRERFPWRGAVLAVRVARLVSLLFGLVTVMVSYGLAREALPGNPVLAWFAAAVVAFTPQFLFISGVVSNDSTAAATCTLALWMLAHILRRGLTTRRALFAGLALGLALLSKVSALLLLPMALLVVILERRTAGDSVNGKPSAGRDRLSRGGLMFALAVAIGGWWYARNWLLFDDPLGLGIHVNTPWGRSEPASLMTLVSELPRIFRSFWGAFGWGHVELPTLVYWGLGVLVILAILGWLRVLVVAGRHRSGRLHAPSDQGMIERKTGPAQSATSLILTMAFGWFLVVFVALLRWMQQVEAPHGRLLFPALGACGLLLVFGWSSLGRRSSSLAAPSRPGSSLAHQEDEPGSVAVSYLLSALPVTVLSFLSLLVPFVVIRPAFAAPRLISPQEALEGLTPQTLLFDDRARLLGYYVEPESVVSGERLRIKLCWEALRPMEQDYTLFIHLLGPDNLRVGERTSFPGQGRFPTSLWPVGRAFCDAYWLEVASWADAPELYALEVGLYDAGTGKRLTATAPNGEVIDPPTVGFVRVVRATPPAMPENLLSYDLGDQIALVGYDSSGRPEDNNAATLVSGEVLTLTLYWQALQVPQGDYKVFVHLLDANGAFVVQDDNRPRDGRYPTWAWQAGDLVPDPHRVSLPDDRPPGPYHWSVGMYVPETEDRLAVTGPDGPLPDGAIPLEVLN
jgi:4-amino-4-deoxy-L-arabinose transferase-like glycosyltransferase